MRGVDNYSKLDDSQKADLKSNMLNNIGLDKTSYEGLDIDVAIENQMIVTIKADLKIVDRELLEIVGLNFTDENINLDNKIKEMTNIGATCK